MVFNGEIAESYVFIGDCLKKVSPCLVASVASNQWRGYVYGLRGDGVVSWYHARRLSAEVRIASDTITNGVFRGVA